MTLASCAKDVRFYKWPNISYFGIYETPVDCMSIKSISWSSNSTELVAVKSKGCPVILNVPVKAEQLVEAFECTYIGCASVGTFSNTNPELVAFGTEDGILIYNTKHTRRHQEYIKLPSPIQNIEFSSDDQCFAVGCVSGQIFLFDSNYKPCASFLVSNSPTLSTLAYSKITPHLLAGASKDGILSLWNTDTTDNLLTTRKHTARVTDITFFDSNISSVGIDGKFISYDLRSCKTSCCCDLECALSSLAYLNGTNELAISTMTGQLRSYDSRNMKTPLKTLVALANSSFKKIAFPFNTDISAFPCSGKSKKYSDNYSASGDFSLTSGSSPRRSNFTPLKLAAEGPTEESTFNTYDTVACSKNTDTTDLEEFSKIVEEKIKIATKDFEEKLLQSFYGLRINTSKQFIGLEEKVSHSWNTFVDYLRFSGQGSNCTSCAGVGVQKSNEKMERNSVHSYVVNKGNEQFNN
ncbi:unnamed protein product [Psylliodes chrysocephalus]|uniref:Uncharacterized protein n=1 Tax=Psylliodes chrysocephalus TaxID=3402493 RepID=A0A9P0D5L0_9CUCU|nr:unnamed protein product [Psylliodes chrysocephala]